MKSNLQPRRFYSLVIAIIMTSLIISAGIIFPNQIRLWDGIYFSEDLPILGNFAVVDWLGTFFALMFLSGWILFFITFKIFSRISIFSWPTGYLLLFIIFFILSLIVVFFLDISVKDSRVSGLIQSGFNFFFSGATAGAFIIFTSDSGSASK